MATTAEQDPSRPTLSKHLNVSSARFPPLESACAEDAGRQVYPLHKPEAPGPRAPPTRREARKDRL